MVSKTRLKSAMQPIDLTIPGKDDSEVKLPRP